MFWPNAHVAWTCSLWVQALRKERMIHDVIWLTTPGSFNKKLLDQSLEKPIE
jgi:uncharacterized RDD family membrane protein YckC